jgi:hypothetical protein
MKMCWNEFSICWGIDGICLKILMSALASADSPYPRWNKSGYPHLIKK